MRLRLLFGPLMIALLVLGLWLDQWVSRQPRPAWLPAYIAGKTTLPRNVVLLPVTALLAVLASRELAAIFLDKGIPASRRIMTSAAILGLLVSALVPPYLSNPNFSAQVGAAIVTTAGVLIFILALAFYSRHKTFQGIVAAAGGTLLAYVYLGLMFGFVLAIRRDHSVWVVLWVLLVIKSCDIGAYFTGKAIGRHKLIFWLSPGKTWEGLIGGVILASLVAAGGLWLLRRYGTEGEQGPLPPPAAGLFAGAVFAVLGQAGDLVMSLFKRDAGRKDSSHLIPGFGGVLDVLDSPLLVTPLAYWWLWFIRYLQGPGVMAG